MVESSSRVWQLPYVNLFKFYKIDQQDWSKACKSGDVSTAMDKTVKSTVFRINGSVSAKNYIMFPKKNNQDLGLYGRYLYLQFKPVPAKFFVFHIEVVTKDDLVVRISVSNLFKCLKCTSTWIQFPYRYPIAQSESSVDLATSRNCKTSSTEKDVNLGGPSPQNSRWTFLSVNLQEMLKVYTNNQFSHIKAIQLCANMHVRNVFTSDSDYDPEISFQDAKKMNALHKLTPIPREMALPVAKGENWNELYCHSRLPLPQASHTFSKNEEPSDMTTDKIPPKSKSQSAKTVSNKLKENCFNPRDFASIKCGAGDAPSSNVTEEQGVFPVDSSVHVYPSIPCQQQTQSFSSKKEVMPTKSTALSHCFSEKMELMERSIKTSLKPDPVIGLLKTMGCSVNRFRKGICWAFNDRFIVYSANAIVIALDLKSHLQKFFVGHSNVVSCVCVNSASTVMVSGQIGEHGIVRIWNFSTCQLFTLFRCPCIDLKSLQFSNDNVHLCAVGNDVYGKAVVVLWDSSELQKRTQMNMLSKVHADIDIQSVQFNPIDSARMVSCGSENIRFWRLKQKALRSCPVALGQYSSQRFTDICFVRNTTALGESKVDHSVFCCSDAGFVLQINSEDIAIRVVRKLVQTVHENISVSLNSIAVLSEYCVSGSNDGKLRVWSLDFSSILLEVDHDSDVILVDPCFEGDKILTVTKSNMVGVLNIATKRFDTHVRCHKNLISSADISVDRNWIVTSSADMHVMVWEIRSGKLVYNFQSESDMPLFVAFAARDEWIFCGFESGAVRVFDIASAQCIHEYTNVLRGSVTGLLVRPCGKQIVVSDSNGTLASLGACQPFEVMRVLTSMLVRKVSNSFSPTLALSADGNRCAFVGPSDYIVSVVDTKTLDELLRIDITQLNQGDLRDSVIEKGWLVGFSEDHIMLVTKQSNLYLLDMFSGKQLTKVKNVQKNECTAISADDRCRFIYTAGDNVLKVWDYKFQYDVNFQMFAGHTAAVNKIISLPENLVLSVGDNICIWQIKQIAPETVALLPEKTEVKKPLTKPRSDLSRTERPQTNVPTPALLNISEIALQPDAVISDSEDVEIAGLECPQNTREADGNAHVSSIDEHNFGKKANETEKEIGVPVDAPIAEPCFKHFQRKEVKSAVATVHYSAPENEAGLELKSLIGFNGNGRDNIIWRTDPGFLYYSCGIVVVVEDLATNKQQLLQGHVSEISTLALRSSGDVLASVSGSNKDSVCQIITWDLKSYTVQHIVSYHQNDVIALKFSPDGRFLLSLGDYREQLFALWKVADMTLVTSTKLNFVANAVAWDRDSANEFCIVGSNCCVQFWALEEKYSRDTGKIHFFMSTHTCETPQDVLRNRSSTGASCSGHSFSCLAYSGLSVLYIGSDQGIVSAWDTRSNKCFMHWVAAPCEISYINAIGSRLITGSVDHKLKLWTVIATNGVNQMSSQLSTATGPRLSMSTPGNGLIMEDEYTLTGSISGASFDENLELGIVATSDCLIWYVNWLERNTVRLVNGQLDQINSVLFCGQNSIATLSNSGIRIYSCKDQELTVHFKTAAATCAAATCETRNQNSENTTSKKSNAKILAVGFYDGSVSFFDLSKVSLIRKVNPHKEKVTHISVAPDNNFILTGSQSGSAALVDMKSAVISRMLSDHKTSPISDASFSKFLVNSNRFFALASQDRKISIWQINWSKDRCVLSDWIIFEGPHRAKSGEVGLNPTLVEFSPTEKEIVLFTGYSFVQGINFYNMRLRKVVRQVDLNAYATFLTISEKGNLICCGTENWLIKLIDYTEGSFQDFLIHSGKVVKASFCQTSPLLVSCAENEAAVWQLQL